MPRREFPSRPPGPNGGEGACSKTLNLQHQSVWRYQQHANLLSGGCETAGQRVSARLVGKDSELGPA